MPWVLFFDGDCGFCSRSIRRLCRWDRNGHLHYASLQGKLAAQHQLQSYLEGDEASMVLLNEEDGSILTQSDGVLQIFRILGGVWRLLLILGYLPKPWRDRSYRYLARNRHRLGAKNAEVCEMPEETLASRLRD